jgi:hypothetical protein
MQFSASAAAVRKAKRRDKINEFMFMSLQFVAVFGRWGERVREKKKKWLGSEKL